FEDRAGRSWHLDTYVRMAGRTIAGQAAVQGELDSLASQGRDLVIISDSPRECELCRPWEGLLLSITGQTPVGTTVDGRRVRGTVADARAAGVWHPNCTHRADPYTPGLTVKAAPKRDPDGYKAQQRLRQLERGARELKRRRNAAQVIGDKPMIRKLNASITEQGRRIVAHTKETGLLRHRDREKPYGG
ncbi:MAG: phage minor capsid protein, partial [Actinomycetota bacterium]|nr:phage minor capsid protein [Actinomycetota bacterium]